MIYFASRTGNVRSIVARLSLPAAEIQSHTVALEPFLLFTYTDGYGDIPQMIKSFMAVSSHLCKGVIVSGNRNFGEQAFCGAGNKLHQQYDIPIVRKFDLRGNPHDLQAVQDYYEKVINGAETFTTKQ